MADAIRFRPFFHGLSNGRWSLIDGVEALTNVWPDKDVVLATWRSRREHIARIVALPASRVRVVLDHHFLTMPDSRAIVADYMRLLGRDNIRFVPNHSKFALITDGEGTAILYLTTANLSRNYRWEAITIFRGGDVPRMYIDFIETLWASIPPADITNAEALESEKRAASTLLEGGARLLPPSSQMSSDSLDDWVMLQKQQHQETLQAMMRATND